MTTVFKVVEYKGEFAAANTKARGGKGKGPCVCNKIRRPTRGITLRDDTFATMRVITSSGQLTSLIDAGGRDVLNKVSYMGKEMRGSDIYSNFLIQSVVEDRQEKAQVLETFGEPYIFFYGERPRVLAISGILLNSWDFNWEAEWWANYDEFLRGTKCVASDSRVYLAFDNTVVGGYILSSNVQKQTQERNWLQFQFQLFVTHYETFSNLGDPRAAPDAYYSGKSGIALDVETELKTGRPPIISADKDPVWVDPSTGDVHGVSASLSASVQLGSLANAWRKAQALVRGTLSTISQVWEGNVVRVPEGFEGSFAYDYDVKVAERKLQIAQTIRYSTFNMNSDEYVGGRSQYGSATMGGENKLSLLSPETNDPKKSLSDQAKKFWMTQGLDPEPGLLAKTAEVIRYARVGISVVNLARGVKGMLSSNRENYIAVKDFSGGLFNWGDIYGNLSKRASGD
jgi:hypothetical protein